MRGRRRPLPSRPRSTSPASAWARSSTDARTAYVGYADKAASEKKVLHDAFRAGDAWFRTGDLLRKDAEGYFYFVDRIGDTFRWKGENVSTSEVAGALAAGAGREGGQRLRRQGRRPRRPRRHGGPGGGRRLRPEDLRRLRRRAPAGLRPAGVPAPAAGHRRSPAPSSTASSIWWPRASTRRWSRTRSTSAANRATRS